MTVSGTNLGNQLRRPRFPENRFLASEAQSSAATTAGTISASSMSPASRKRPARTRIGSDCGSISDRSDCPPDPFENEQKYPGVKIGARGKNHSGRLLLWVRYRHRRPAAVSQSRLRRSGAKEVGPGPLLQRSELLQFERSHAPVSRRNVVCLLPRRAQSGQAAGRSRTSRSGRICPLTSARSISGSIASFDWERDPTSYVFQLFHTSRPGRSIPRSSPPTTSTIRGR